MQAVMSVLLEGVYARQGQLLGFLVDVLLEVLLEHDRDSKMEGG